MRKTLQNFMLGAFISITPYSPILAAAYPSSSATLPLATLSQHDSTPSDVALKSYNSKSHNSQAAKECTPHYLENVYRPDNSLENLLEKDRVYRSMQGKYPGTGTKSFTTGSMEVQTELAGKKVTLHFSQYVRRGKEIYHYHALGMDKLTEEQFDCVVQDQIDYLKQAADWAVQDYKNILASVLEMQEKTLKEQGVLKEEQKLEELLDKEIPGYGITLRETLFTPDITLQDFIPENYTFGELPQEGILGVALLQGGRIGIDPKARVLDYLNGIPTVLIHEMTHNNPKLQNIPFSNVMDLELWASFPMLAYDDMGHFLRHSYLRDVHKVAKILFNFDQKKAYQDLIALDLPMGTELEKDKDFAKARAYAEKVKTISREIRDTVFNVYLPVFFSNPLYFMAVNDFLQDKNASFKLTMYLHYEPTLLGGPEKTREFLEEHEHIIEQTNTRVMNKLKEEQEERRKKQERGEEQENGEEQEIFKALRQKLIFLPDQEAVRKKGYALAKQLGISTSDEKQMIEWGKRLYHLGLIDIPPVEE